MPLPLPLCKPVSVLVLLAGGGVIAVGHTVQGAGAEEALIVKCTRPCAAVTAAVVTAGGQVTQRYDNVDAIAVRVPSNALAGLVALAGADAVRKDIVVSRPVPETFDITDQLGAVTPLSDEQAAAVEASHPANYNYNVAFTNIAGLHAAGQRGQNVIVAVIDTGTAAVTPALLPTLAGSVIGGETFVPAAQDPLSATHRENASHGTETAMMVAAHAAFAFANTSLLVRALNLYAPGSAIPCSSLPPGTCPATFSVVPLTGTAPGARIYAMKVFAAQGGGAPDSRIIAAVDRAITLRKNFNAGGANVIASGSGTETDPFVYSALKIDVVNMSLGGPSLFAGRDIEDQLTIEMVRAGITLAASAGNDGFGALTIGTPGSGFGSLTVGAANTAVHERVLRDNQFGHGVGALYRASEHTQTAYFSSRGPNPDGRNDPDLLANGFASFVLSFTALTNTLPPAITDCRAPNAAPGTCAPRFVFASGTSFSSPTVAGAAAVLHRAHPTRNAAQIRNALHKSANPGELGDDSTPIDRGKGVLDAGAADALLTAGTVSSRLPDLGSICGDGRDDELGAGGSSLSHNLRRAGFRIARFTANRYTATLSDLKPGEVAQIFVPSDFLTSNLTVTIDNVVAALPPDEQNALFGDDVFMMIIDAPVTTAVERAARFVAAGATATLQVPNPQTGLVRVAVQGDWTNAGNVSARVTVTRQRRFDGLPTSVGLIEQDETDFVEVDVPAGASRAVFEVGWSQNWSRYPTNDIDMIVIDPAGNVIDAGATINSPERVEIANPAAGRWNVAIVGFTVQGDPCRNQRSRGARDLYVFRAQADGARLKPVR